MEYYVSKTCITRKTFKIKFYNVFSHFECFEQLYYSELKCDAREKIIPSVKKHQFMQEVFFSFLITRAFVPG